jgi:hypothetical protein
MTTKGPLNTYPTQDMKITESIERAKTQGYLL